MSDLLNLVCLLFQLCPWITAYCECYRKIALLTTQALPFVKCQKGFGAVATFL